MHRVLLAVSALVFLGACGGGGGDGTTSPTPPPASTGVASVSVALSATQITVGGAATATAELRTSAGAVVAGRAVSWTSSTPTVAAVNDAGTITALAAGSATITATSEGKSGAASLTVIPAPVATMQVTLALPSLTLGTTTTASAVLRDERGATLTGRAVAWSSSAPAVATVDIGGAITTLAVGATVITATSEGKSASATLTVTPVPVATVSVAIPQSSLTVGSSTQVTATVRSANGQVLTDRVITLSSSAPNVASVSSAGVVLAIAPGTATISATSEGRLATVAVTVLAPTPAVVQISPTSVTLSPSQTASLTATVRDASGNVMTGQPVLWSSSNTSVATVTQTGVVTGVATGVVSVTATSGGRSAAATVTVQPAIVAAVALNYVTTTIVPGDVRVLIATARDAANNVVSGRAVTWTSSNLTVVDGYVYGDTAVITGLKSGSSTITATIDGRSASAVVNVVASTSSICTTIAGASIYGDDNEYLGRFTNQYDSQSVLNEYGAYGSPYRSTSTNNTYGTYGSPYSSLSARNPYASRPPRIIKNGTFLAYYTANSFKTPAVSPAYAMTCPFP
jgi:uncharacterized protein YjdB